MEEEKKLAMFSQPLRGKTDEEIKDTRERATKFLESLGYEVINTPVNSEYYKKELESNTVVNVPLLYLAKSLENMAHCHVAYFCKGWEQARGCMIELEVAKKYGLEIICEPNIIYNTNQNP